MIRFISKQIHLFLRRVGYQIVSANSFLRSQDVVELLISRDVKVRNIFDVGAHRGEWTLAISKYLNQDVTVTMFEPSSHHKANLEAIANQFGHRYLPIALGKSMGMIDFYSTGGTGDSFYEEIEMQNKTRVLPISTKVETLDYVIDNYSLIPPDLLKLDCQGSELDILKGGENFGLCFRNYSGGFYTSMQQRRSTIGRNSLLFRRKRFSPDFFERSAQSKRGSQSTRSSFFKEVTHQL